MFSLFIGSAEIRRPLFFGTGKRNANEYLGDPQQSHSRDVALAAIAQAHRQIGNADEQLVQIDEPPFKLEGEKNAILLTSNRALPSRAGVIAWQAGVTEPHGSGSDSVHRRCRLCVAVTPRPSGTEPHFKTIGVVEKRKRNYPHSRPHLTLTSRLRQMQDLRNHHLRWVSTVFSRAPPKRDSIHHLFAQND